MASKRSWDFYYRTLNRLVPGAEHEQPAYFKIVRNHVRPGITWLDAGCGHSLVPDWMKGSRELEDWFLNTAQLMVGCVYVKCFFHRAIQHFPQFGQSLRAVARKPLDDAIERSDSSKARSGLGMSFPRKTGESGIGG